MKPHNWEKEIVTIRTASPISSQFWKCKECKASGGPVQPDAIKPAWGAFLAGTNLIDLSDDCDEAKKAIAEYWKKYPANEPFRAEG